MSASKLEAEFILQLRAYQLMDGCELEFRFDPVRRWRFDFAWPEERLAVELQGGIWQGKSGHNTGKGLLRDMEKGNAAQAAGWSVLHFAAEHLADRSAVMMVSEMLAERRGVMRARG